MCRQIEGKQWSFLTDDAKDLVCQMLEADPNRRVTVDDALKHPWIRVSYLQNFVFKTRLFDNKTKTIFIFVK